MREGVVGQVRGAYRYYTQEQVKLELNARNALKTVIKNLAKSSDPKLKYLYTGGYAYELYKIRNFIAKNRAQPQAQPQAQQQQPQAQPQTQESIGQAIGNLVGSGGLLGGMWSKAMRSKEMTQHNELENQAIKALQALADRVNYEKGEMYYSGYGSRIQWYVSWMKKAQAFNNTRNMGVSDETPPEEYTSYRRVQQPHLRYKRVAAPGQQPGQQPGQPKKPWWNQ
jgi:hypothetical protein